jgi:phosphoadenosine phosphosulfate reductase
MSAIDLHARRLPGFHDRVAQSLAVLRDAAASHSGRIVQATSLGAEDMVITDLIARHGFEIDIATLATGKLHEETEALVPRIEAHYGLRVTRFEPKPEAVIHFVRSHGEKAMVRSIELRKACCNVRKLEPLSRMLEGRTAWVTGLRREQSDARAEVALLQPGSDGRVKVNPLGEWSWADVWHYIAEYGVPYNPLHDEFFPSIGCAPCTRAVAVGEPFRAGRWWWEDEAAKECGLHVEGDARVPSSSRIAVTA